MSVQGLERAEQLAEKANKNLTRALKQVAVELRSEMDKMQYLLKDTEQARLWATQPANASKLAQILRSMDEVEKLYLQAGDSRGARIFKTRMRGQLETRLTNLQAETVNIKLSSLASRLKAERDLVSSLTAIETDARLYATYEQALQTGGFFSHTGRPHLQDLVTLSTKSAGSKSIGDYMSKLYDQYEEQLLDVFVRGIVRGDSYNQMKKNLVNATAITAGKADLLITTEANSLFNEGQRQVISKNPLIKGYRFRAVLDSRTSKQCQEMDGKYIPKEQIKIGVNFPPLHPRCRSTVTVVLVSEDERKDTMQRYTMNGSNRWEKVPRGMTYKEFKDRFGFQDPRRPQPHTASPRVINETVMASPTTPQPQNYVKPSVSAVRRIDRLIDAYLDNDTDYIKKVRLNTGIEEAPKALYRQALLETGYGGLPTYKNAKDFDGEVEKGNLVKVYRAFTNEAQQEQLLKKDMPESARGHLAGLRTYTEEIPNKEGTIEMALRSKPDKILRVQKFEEQLADGKVRNRYSIQDQDSYIGATVREVEERNLDSETILSMEAIKYGYDAIHLTDSKGKDTMMVLNRTALIVKEPTQMRNTDELRIFNTQEEIKSSKIYKREDTISRGDTRIVKTPDNVEYVPNVIASSYALDNKMPKIDKEVYRKYKETVSYEPKATSCIMNVADSIEGAEVVGGEFAIKAGSSTQRKILSRVEKERKTQMEVFNGLDDILRYTISVPYDETVKATRAIMHNLESQGLKVIELDNKWLKPEKTYKGIHLRVKLPNGIPFEVQVHSPESLKVKEENHPLYDILRQKKGTEKELRDAWAKMYNNTATLNSPKDIEKLKSFNKGR